MSDNLFTGPNGNSPRTDIGLAAGYLRVSTEAQLDGYGPEIQLDAVTVLADTERLDLAAVFTDEGISGGEGLETRTGLAKALDWLAEHPGATLIIPRLDRLARDLMVQESILADAWRTGATVLSCSETERTYCRPDSPDDPARTLIRQVLGAVAAYERAMIRLRMMRGRRRLLDAQGWAGGPVPYGWADEDEGAVLRHIAAGRQHGVRWVRLAEQLNTAGRYKRSGTAWTPQEVQRTYSRATQRTTIDPEALPLGQGALL